MERPSSDEEQGRSVSGLAILLVTYPSSGDYASWCRSLVERGLAACINIASIKSTYFWEGRVVEDEEVLLIMKTHPEMVEPLKEAVRREHPYSVPEIVELRPVDVNKPYLNWVTASTLGRRR